MEPEDFREAWINIAELDLEGSIKFTKQYLEISILIIRNLQ